MGKHRRTSGMKDALSEMFGAPAEPKIRLTAAGASAMVANVETPGTVAVRLALIPVDVAEHLIEQNPQLKTWLIAQLEVRVSPGALAVETLNDIAQLGPGFLQTTPLPQGIKVPSPVPIDHEAAHEGREASRKLAGVCGCGHLVSCHVGHGVEAPDGDPHGDGDALYADGECTHCVCAWPH
jgi:hypothetical protein